IDNHITSFLTNDNLDLVTHIEKSIEDIVLSEIEDIDVIFHMASVASPLVYKNDFRNVYNPNVKGTEKLIELAKRDSSRLIFTSTSEVYGMLDDDITQGTGISEDSISISHLLTERSIYPTSKKMGEELVKNYINQGGDAVILRLFNVYGPEMDVRNNGYGRVIPNFINAIRQNKEIKIFGDGKQVRSFIWIDDIIEALELLMDVSNMPHVINIGNSEPISIYELAEMIFKLDGKRVAVRYIAKDPDDPIWRKPNINIIRSLVNWVPRTSLKEGLSIILKEQKNE
ncbi:MAG: NAD-dependent epimerase/dehydratase family protein, partial [Acholeplasmataceae bacterium]|nr:NAD-dependent epimerase/dehydratase family protein [Acholeplasmataceae bacterium]